MLQECLELLDSVLDEVASIRPANARRGTQYMLKREAWSLLDPYYLHGTTVCASDFILGIFPESKSQYAVDRHRYCRSA